NPMGAAAAPAKPEAPKPDAPKAVPADQLKDVTNLLPGATSALVRINVERVVQTPFYNAFLDRPTLDFFRSAMTFEATDIQTAIVCLVDPDREPFAVIRTKVPVNEKLMYERLDLSLDGEPIQGRNAFLIKSNAFVQAISRALSTESLLGEAGLPITEEDKKRWKERPMGMTVYDSQTIIIAEMDILKRWLIDLNPKTGYPPFVTELTAPDAVAPMPMTPGSPMADPAAGNPGGGDSDIVNPQGGSPMGGRGGQPQGGPGGESKPLPMPGAVGGGPPLPNVGVIGGGGAPATGPAAGAPPVKLFTSIPTYRTVKSELKQLLNRLESDEKNTPAAIYAEILDQRFYARDMSAMQQVGLVLQVLIKNVQMIGVAVTHLNRDKIQAQILFQYINSDDAKKSVSESISPLLSLLKGFLSQLLGTPINIRGGGNANSGGSPDPSGGAQGGGGDDVVSPSGGGSAPSGPPRGSSGGPGGPTPGGPGAPTPSGGTQPAGGDGSTLSHIDVNQNDVLVSVDGVIYWNNDRYSKLIVPAIVNVAKQLQGRMQVLSGDTTWHQLANAAQKLIKDRKQFPAGTIARESRPERYGLPYPPDQRMSLFVELLPYIGKGPLRSIIQDKKHAWYAKENIAAAQTWVPEFLVPYYPQSSWRANHPLAEGRSLGGTNYVAVAGVGLDAARYNPTDPAFAKLAGITGYDWGSKPAEITDGLSNTMYMLQVPPGYNRPWIAGGGATVQGVADDNDSLKDFVHTTPEKKRGTYALMADGVVRWIPEGTDSKIFRALATRAGGETITELDKIAPKVAAPKQRDVELSTPRAGVAAGAPPKTPPVVDKWEDAAEAELAKFQGRWAIVMLSIGANKFNESQAKVLKANVEIEGRRVTTNISGNVISIDEFTKLDLKVSPKVIEAKQLQGTMAGKTASSIYEFVGEDTLRMRGSIDGKSLPKELKPPEGNSTDSYIELRRIKN
ncbi:MAG: DUF1559 domain-containing protein, partial [Gemmataceae bacterium]